MTVGELRERLDDYGDHLPVKVVVIDGETEQVFDVDVDDRQFQMEPTVVFEVEV